MHSSASPDRPTKTCPDCAETVLAAARKCRFCGYRFDGGTAAPEPERDAEGGVLGALLRRAPRKPVTVPGLLAQWGVQLAHGEQPSEILLCDVDGVPGYLVVTDVRLLSFPVAGPRKSPRPHDERPLRELVALETVHRRLRRPVLTIDWWRSQTVIAGLSAADAKRLEQHLSPHLPPATL